MLLALDVGNTDIKLALFNGAELLEHERFPSADDSTWLDLEALAGRLAQDSRDVEAVAAASVVPDLEPYLADICRCLFNVEIHFITAATARGMSIRYAPPESLGADRLANAVAAYDRFRRSVIVVDAGTATKVEAVGEDGAYLGGAIAPGLRTSSAALFQSAAKLEELDLISAEDAIATNTADALRSGILYGFGGLVDGLVARFRREMAPDTPVIATGGLAPLLQRHSTTLETVDSLLTLQGIRLLWERR